MIYGYVGNPMWSTFRNLTAVIGNMPSWLYFSRASNMAFHNLTNNNHLLPGFRSLLGLGLGFCPVPRLSTPAAEIDVQRCIRNVKLKMFFGDDDKNRPIPKLYFKSDWKPPESEFSSEFTERLSVFQQSIDLSASTRKFGKSNLLPMQRSVFSILRRNKNLHVFKTDKNLGPAVIETDRYIRRAWEEHLSDGSTYGQLHELAAETWMDELKVEIQQKIIAKLPKGNDKTYLTRSIAAVKDPFCYFYLLAKVHKTPWKTRPIISVSGSLLHGLGKWVDMCLQHIISTLPYVCRSSYHLAQELRALKLQSADVHLFTMDAVSMYTNIDTKHALTVIGTFINKPNIKNLLQHQGVNPKILLDGLTIIMSNNVFKFGDTYWYQKTGTAMGTPPAPPYATLYFALHEMEVIKKFPRLLFYRRLIDDGLGAWQGPADANFEEFKATINNYGKLSWEFSSMAKEVNYLDLTISVVPDSPPGRSCSLGFKLFEKALNLYLYLPPNSAHPPGILKGLIYGMVLRLRRLTSDDNNIFNHVLDLYRRLRQRGYSAATLQPLFEAAMLRTEGSTRQKTDKKLLFLHLPFHPSDPPASSLRKIFLDTVGRPQGKQPLNQLHGRLGSRRTFGDYRFIVAYSRQPTLGNLLSPRRLRTNRPIMDIVDTKGTGAAASAIFQTATTAAAPLNLSLAYPIPLNQPNTTSAARNDAANNTSGREISLVDAAEIRRTAELHSNFNLSITQQQNRFRAPNLASNPYQRRRLEPCTFFPNQRHRQEVDIPAPNVLAPSYPPGRQPRRSAIFDSLDSNDPAPPNLNPSVGSHTASDSDNMTQPH